VIFLAWMVGKGLGFIPLGIVTAVRERRVGDTNMYDFSSILDFPAMGMSLNLGVFLMLFAFAVGLFVFIGLIRLFHNGRTYKETINGTKKIRWNRVWVGVWTWGAIMAIAASVDVLVNPENFVFQFDAARFIPLIFIVLLLIPLQTTFEEITFRGYFAQGLAGLTRSRWVAFLVPSIVFGLIHAGNPEVAEFGFWVVMPKYIIGGLVYGLISTLDDGIELAIGAHAIHNIFLCLFFTHSASALRTYALFEIQEVDMGIRSILVSLAFSTIFVAFLAWKYKWDFSILNKRVEIKEEENINVDTQ